MLAGKGVPPAAFSWDCWSSVVPTGSIVLGIDDTIERRRGKRIQAKGIYRDPLRSSHSHFVKASGLRWMSLIPVPWAARTLALPFLTCLAPSERYMQKHRKRHKPVLDWARQMVSNPALVTRSSTGGGRR